MAERGRPLFSIGAVGRMVDLAPATIRTWETRYGLIVPQRSQGGQRLYSRAQVDQLRFVKDAIAAGRRPAEAHRLLAERGASGGLAQPLRVLLAENRLGAADVLRRLLGAEDFEVVLATDGPSALAKLDEFGPTLVVVDTEDAAFSDLSARVRAEGTKVLPLDLLERPASWLESARGLVD